MTKPVIKGMAVVNEQATVVLMAEDDDDDRFLLKRAAKEVETPLEVYFANDGGELLDYLFRQNSYKGGVAAPRPDLILLDINMPVKDGLEALQIIKKKASLRSIPVVIWSTSRDNNHVEKAAQLGACDYVVKPDTFEGLVASLKRVLSHCLST